MTRVTDATILIVPGLRDEVAEHWQTLLAARTPRVISVAPMGRGDLDCASKVAAIERAAGAVSGPFVVVAHSAGTLMVAHWARSARRKPISALLAAPPDFETPMPAGYPTIEALRAGGWLPIPRQPLGFPSIVAASRNDPLAKVEWVTALAADWGARLVDLGEVGHLNPASGFGAWPAADGFIAALAQPHRISA